MESRIAVLTGSKGSKIAAHSIKHGECLKRNGKIPIATRGSELKNIWEGLNTMGDGERGNFDT